ncbi:-lysine N-methyltransferase rrg1 [Lecanosticta acicola]|uniref:-lysine N-methyltransferase rrg1 n=1 Tax=Lecanosticta acicola TaxID=111012 RepID=A0AAI8W1I2_9PEZI|nr:-lysine N-methyltransferase rrg1 [Lecanosticta acicola]
MPARITSVACAGQRQRPQKQVMAAVEDLGPKDFEEEDAEEALDVLDLPQLHTEPTPDALLATLADLSSEPAAWEPTPKTAAPPSPLSGASTPIRRKRRIRSEGVPRYLTNIISSPLAWIEDDGEKERVWEAASQRLAERSGRSAMGAIRRTFVIPVHATSAVHDTISRNPLSTSDAVSAAEPSPTSCVELTLHEPALTSDNLGLKTWASSHLLAKRLGLLRHALPSVPSGTAILELGAGTGLVGLAAAAVFHTAVILTDLPAITPNLERNAHANESSVSAHGGKARVAVLDWLEPGAFRLNDTYNGNANMFSLILAADPIYSPEHPRLLAQAIEYHLSKDTSARVIVEMPLRDAYGSEREDFKVRMEAVGLVVVDQGEETGFDDWVGKSEELLEVKCWWTIWAWR